MSILSSLDVANDDVGCPWLNVIKVVEILASSITRVE
jgi:hypothetical protein